MLKGFWSVLRIFLVFSILWGGLRLFKMENLISVEVQDERVLKFKSETKTFQDFVNAISGKECEEFFQEFVAILKNANFESFYFECPPINRKNVDKKFEFVIVKSESLHRRKPDPEAFSEHFRQNCLSAVFQNLGADATLIAPCPSTSKNYGHISNYMKNASQEEIKDLWKNVGDSISENLSSKPLWISTAGDGVSWLHIRLDSYPKYYNYGEYKTV